MTDQTKIATGRTRNQLYIKANSVQYGFTYNNNWYRQGDVGNGTINITGAATATVKGTDLTSGTAITIDSLQESDVESTSLKTVSMSYNRYGTSYSTSGIKLFDLYKGNGELSIQLAPQY